MYFLLDTAKNQSQFGQDIDVHLKGPIWSFKKMPWIKHVVYITQNNNNNNNNNSNNHNHNHNHYHNKIQVIKVEIKVECPWSGIWNGNKEHNRNAECLKNFKEENTYQKKECLTFTKKIKQSF